MPTSTPTVWVHGVTGRMGKLVRQAAIETEGLRYTGGSARSLYNEKNEELGAADRSLLADRIAQVDLVIDFSSVAANHVLIESIQTLSPKERPAVLLATTGLADQQLAEWHSLNDSAVLIAPNTSLGIMVLAQVTRQLAAYLPGKGFDPEIVETHHRHKVDAPSGTARFLCEAAVLADRGLVPTEKRQGKRQPKEIGLHAMRGGNVFGEHEVRFLGDQEEIYLGHRAFSRELFAYGATTLGQWLLKQPAGIYNLYDVDLTQ